MNIINLLINKFQRIINKKEVIVVALIIIPLMIGAAVLFSEKPNMKEKIAFVSEGLQKAPQNSRFIIDVMDKKPATSELLLGNYDAIVDKKSNGSYEVTTVIKSKTDKKIIEDFFNQGKIPEAYESEETKRGMGTSILGFLVMIVLMQGVALTVLYPEDRTLKTFRRVLTAPVSEGEYLLAQGIFTFICVYVPTYVAIFIAKICFGVKIGFSFLILAIVIGILTALTTAFALFLSSLLEQNISLVASGIAVITCLLAGCFNSFYGNNRILDALLNVLPQKAYMSMIQGVEKGKGILEFKGQLIYLLICTIALWFLGSIISKNKMKKGIF